MCLLCEMGLLYLRLAPWTPSPPPSNAQVLETCLGYHANHYCTHIWFLNTFSYAHVFSVCCMFGSVWARVKVWMSEDSCWCWFSPCPMWVLGIPLSWENLGGKHPCPLNHLIGPVPSHFIVRQIYVDVMRHHHVLCFFLLGLSTNELRSIPRRTICKPVFLNFGGQMTFSEGSHIRYLQSES